VAVASPPEALAFPAYRTLPQTATTIPDRGEPLPGRLDPDYAVFRRLHADLDRDDEAPRHPMSGWPDPAQNPQLECELTANGIDSRANVGRGQMRAVVAEQMSVEHDEVRRRGRGARSAVTHSCRRWCTVASDVDRFVDRRAR
jgi:hypothetical protein